MSKILLLALSMPVLSFSATRFDGPSPVTKSSPYKKMIHLNPLAMTIGGFELGFEKATTQKESFLFTVGYYLSENAGFLKLKDDNLSDMNGLRVDLQYRFYRKPNNYIKNVFLAPFANFKTLTATHTNDYDERKSSGPPNYTYTTIHHHEVIQKSATTVAVGYMMGIRTSVFENIYMDAAFGGGVFIPVSGDYHKDLNIGFFSPYQKGVHFRASLGFLIAL